MSATDRKILKTLARAHGLSLRERWRCRKIARIYGLDGKGGPATSPAMLFLRPSFWRVFLRDARSGVDRRLRPEMVEGLRRRIFGEGAAAPVGSAAEFG